MSNLIIGLLILLAAGPSFGQLEIINVRVGQGDATLILGPEDPQGKRIRILFDAGDISGRDGGNILRTVLAKRDVQALDHLIISHYDADHIGGVVSGGAHGISFLLGFNGEPGADGDDDNDGADGWVGQRFYKPDRDELGAGDDLPVGQFVDRGDESPPTSKAYKKYKLMAEAYGNRRSISSKRELNRFEIDLGDGARLTALAANGFVKDRTARVKNVNTENERSLAFLLTYKDFHYLIGGDLIGRTHGKENAKVEKAVGQWIEDEGIIVDVLHVNHHGGNNASSTDFLESIQPTIAVISAGNGNTHSHPNRFVLDRLVDAGVYRIIQTSWGTTRQRMPEKVREVQAIYQNDIVITTDGEDFEISTRRSFKADVNPNNR